MYFGRVDFLKNMILKDFTNMHRQRQATPVSPILKKPFRDYFWIYTISDHFSRTRAPEEKGDEGKGLNLNMNSHLENLEV